MKILIIGGCGYIGSRLYFHLMKDYVEPDIDVVDTEWFGNFSCPENINKDFGELSKVFIQKYDTIILLAGHSSVKMSEGNMLSVLKNNVLNFARLLNNMSSSQKLIYASSSSVYGDTNSQMVDEEHTSFVPNNFYDLSKYEIDCYASLSNKTYFGLRFGTVNGSSPNFRNDIMVNAMTFNAISNGKVFCFNPGIHRPILGINDLCCAIETIINKGTHANRGVYNLASVNLTAREIATQVAHEADVPLEIVDSLPDTVTNIKLQTKAYDFMIDPEKFKRTFSFEFKDSIQSIVQSIIKDFDKIEKGSRSSAVLY